MNKKLLFKLLMALPFIGTQIHAAQIGTLQNNSGNPIFYGIVSTEGALQAQLTKVAANNNINFNNLPTTIVIFSEAQAQNITAQKLTAGQQIVFNSSGNHNISPCTVPSSGKPSIMSSLSKTFKGTATIVAAQSPLDLKLQG